jgi:hypothetical protein
MALMQLGPVLADMPPVAAMQIRAEAFTGIR